MNNYKDIKSDMNFFVRFLFILIDFFKVGFFSKHLGPFSFNCDGSSTRFVLALEKLVVFCATFSIFGNMILKFHGITTTHQEKASL